MPFFVSVICLSPEKCVLLVINTPNICCLWQPNAVTANAAGYTPHGLHVIGLLESAVYIPPMKGSTFGIQVSCSNEHVAEMGTH
jgi:hypothetical protein